METRSESVDTPAEVSDDTPKLTFKHDLRFWLVFIALCVTSLLAALEGTVTSTALPTIVADLHIGDNYPWVSNAYFLTTYVKYLYCVSLPLSTKSDAFDPT